MTGGREPPARSGDVSHPRDRGGACLIPAGYRPATSGHGPGPGAAGSETTRSPEPLVATRGRCGGGHVADSRRLPRTGRQMAPAILRTRPAPGPGGGRGASRVTGHPWARARAHTHTHTHLRGRAAGSGRPPSRCPSPHPSPGRAAHRRRRVSSPSRAPGPVRDGSECCRTRIAAPAAPRGTGLAAARRRAVTAARRPGPGGARPGPPAARPGVRWPGGRSERAQI